MLTNPVLVSVIVMTILCLLKLNIIISIIISALVGGFIAGLPLGDIMTIFLSGMGKNTETALSYILLGALAYGLQESGITAKLGNFIEKTFGKSAKALIFGLAFIACFSQNLVPVHIAFIPILIPPLVSLMNKLKIDRRAVACALTFGVKMPYIAIPVGFGKLFHGIIAKAMDDNNMPYESSVIWKSMLIPALGMFLGLLVAVFFSYRKPRDYKDIVIAKEETDDSKELKKEHIGAIAGAVAAFVVQVSLENIPKKWNLVLPVLGYLPIDSGALALGALVGLLIMLAFGTIKFKDFDDTINGGVGMMGFIAFVMLVAAGYGKVLTETGGVEELVLAAGSILGNSKIIGAFGMLLLGLLITMGIGTSFGTIPIVATIYVPLSASLGFSPAATACLIGVAAALGDAGSPASDSTLGPTMGLNVDGQHNHIRDTCIPTFLHYNTALILFGVIAALIL